MSQIESFIEGSQKLTNIFGYWPSFHDAEVIELNLLRCDSGPNEESPYEFTKLTTKLHVWELTNEVNAEGYLVRRHHMLTSLLFIDIEELKINGFNHQNVIFALTIERQKRSDGPSPVYAVKFDSSFGMRASFTAFRIEVADAVPCTEGGKALIQ